MIARWNIRVKHAYTGLLWVGGPQVDPGYVGHLFCPIYNLSDKPVTLRVGEPIALIDFEKTTTFDPTKPEAELKRYPWPPKRMFIEDYGIDDLRSALFTRAGQKLVEFEEQIKNLEARFILFTQLSFAIFAVVIALVALLSRTNTESIALSTAFFGAATLALSFATILIAVFSFVPGRVGRLVYEQYGRIMGERAEAAQRFLRRSWLFGIAISMLFVVGLAWMLYNLIEPPFREFRQQRMLTKPELDTLMESTAHRINGLSARVENIERRPIVTFGDLDNLKAVLEKEIQAIKSAR